MQLFGVRIYAVNIPFGLSEKAYIVMPTHVLYSARKNNQEKMSVRISLNISYYILRNTQTYLYSIFNITHTKYSYLWYEMCNTVT